MTNSDFNICLPPENKKNNLPQEKKRKEKIEKQNLTQ